MQSSFLIFIPTLNYCISPSMNERKRYAMKPPPWKKIGYAQVCSEFPFKKKCWKTRSKFFTFSGLVFISNTYLIMKWTRTLGWWKTCFKKWSKIFWFFCQYISAPPYFFLIFWEKKTLQRMKKIYQNLQCDEKRLRKFVFSLQWLALLSLLLLLSFFFFAKLMK